MSALFEEDLYEVLSPYAAVKRRNSAGGTGFEQIEKALEKAKGLTKEVIKNWVEKYASLLKSGVLSFLLVFKLWYRKKYNNLGEVYEKNNIYRFTVN